METPNLRLVEPSPKFYCVFLKEGAVVRVQAACYTCTDYGSFAFYREDIELVNRAYLKQCPPSAIFEIPRRDVHSIAEDGIISIEKLKKSQNIKKVKKAVTKKTKSVLVKKKAQGN